MGVAHGSNLEKNKRYDQILQYPQYSDNFTNSGGVLDLFIDDAHIKKLFTGQMTKEVFTYQMSDNLPLWMQINTNITGQQLQQIIRG